jgi:nucleotide-binding universal stress UspA family protein
LAVTAQTYRGEPAAVIAQTAEQIGADVIVLGTHGKAGMDAFWSGSVTPKVARQTHIPLLLIRAVNESQGKQ